MERSTNELLRDILSELQELCGLSRLSQQSHAEVMKTYRESVAQAKRAEKVATVVLVVGGLLIGYLVYRL